MVFRRGRGRIGPRSPAPGQNGLRLPTSPLRNPPTRSGAVGRPALASSDEDFAEPCGGLGLAFAVVFGFAVVVFLAVVFFAVVFFAAALLADGFPAAVVLAVAARLVVPRGSVAVGGLIADIVLAAVVSCSAADIIALVAVFIAFRAVFIA
jgi:hypothetical protein